MVEKKLDKNKEAPKKEAMPKEKKTEKNVKGIKRIAGKDVSGDYTLAKALLQVRGIGKSLNHSIAKILASKIGVPWNIQVGDLTDDQIENIDKVLNNIHKHGLPEFMLNRRKDYLDGTSKHLLMNDLIFAIKQDVEREKNIYTWKGYRHAYGQKVRGQRTRNTGRMGMTVGVLRKAVLTQTKAAGQTGGQGGKGGGTGATKSAASAKK